MLTRKDMFDKYYASDIFNQNPDFGRAPKTRLRHNRSCLDLESTKQDVFNIAKEKRINRNRNLKQNEPQKESCFSAERRKENYEKIYGSDIFNERKPNKNERRRGRHQIPNKNNRSCCFDDMKNNDEYTKDLIYYTKQHRAEKKEFSPKVNSNRMTAQERYFNQYYENHGNVISPGNNIYSEENIDKNKINYILKRRNIEKNEKIYNDVGADKKREEGQVPQKEIRYVKKHPITNENKKYRRYVDLNEFPENNCRINKQIEMESHIFSNYKNYYNKSNEEINEINDRIKKEQSKRYNADVLGQPYIRVNRDLSKNDPSLYGAVHSKWGQTNIVWSSPEAEVMFGKTYTDSVYQKYGPNPTAYQRKLNQLADSQSKDTLSGYDKSPIYNYQKPEKDEQVNDETTKMIGKMVDSIPNINEGQKLGIKNKASVLDFTDDSQWDNKARTLNEFYRKKASKPKNKEITEKPTSVNKNNNDNKDYGYHDYVITYALKNNQFEKFDEKDIQKLFANKGVNVYDVHKNPFPTGNYNTISLKVTGNNENNEINDKVKLVQEDLKNKNYKINIEKGEVKNIKKNQKRMVSNPGGKIGIMPDQNPMNAGSTFKIMPPEVRARKGFIKEFNGVNYSYKRPNA